MFTGLVTDRGTVVSASSGDGLRRIRIETRYDPQTIAIGASIACSGPCLTVVATGARAGGAWFDVDVSPETLARTNLRDWHPGTRVNLERSLRVGDELGGHIVTGHVDGVAEVLARTAVSGGQEGDQTAVRFDLRSPGPLARFIAEKGSVCLDGTSLTVNAVEADAFSVMLIPHTLTVTTWDERRDGDRVNLEIDLMARYAARLAAARDAGY